MPAPSFFRVRGLCLGQGRPKICIPLVSEDLPTLLSEARALTAHPFDLVEWRADCFAAHRDTPAVLAALQALREILEEIPLLFTFRTQGEGGKAPLGFEEYKALNLAVARAGLADLIDLELFSAPQEEIAALIGLLHREGAGVVLSSHDFKGTPPAPEIARRLTLARRLGADLPKVAVMPRCGEDVLALLSATLQANREGAGPLITMSMGPLGGVSRLCGEVFGSALTFGCAGRASAPGQFPAQELDAALSMIHRSL